MTKHIFVAAVAFVALATGCETRPQLGTQIDRMGRPAINTAVTNPFGIVPDTTPDDAKDTYNSLRDPATWGAGFSAAFAANLAVLDALDGTCGNQLAAAPESGGNVPSDRYAALSGVLADDQLYVNAASGTCTAYLAMEAVYTGLAPSLASDCGGRTPSADVIDVSYSILAVGAPSGVGDGIDTDGDGEVSLSAFPFLRAPN